MNPLEMQKQSHLMSLNDPPMKPSPPVVLSKRNLTKIPDYEKAITEHLGDLLLAMLDLAKGHYHSVAKFNPKTGEVETRVYEIEPDFKAIAFLIENVMGKASQRIELTGDGGGPIQVIPWMTTAEAVRQAMLHKPEPEESEEVTEGEFTVTEDLDGEPS